MTKPTVLSDEDRAELVAYLDGELDEKSTLELEARLSRDPQARAEATAQVLLGVRMQCARCHNHPFDR